MRRRVPALRTRLYRFGRRRPAFEVPARRTTKEFHSPGNGNPQETVLDVAPDASAGRDDLALRELRSEDRPIFPVIVLKRTLTLTLDAILLTLASPFFALWWATRLVRKLAGKS